MTFQQPLVVMFFTLIGDIYVPKLPKILLKGNPKKCLDLIDYLPCPEDLVLSYDLSLFWPSYIHNRDCYYFDPSMLSFKTRKSQ